MTRQSLSLVAATLTLVGHLLSPGEPRAQVTMADYTAIPPFAADASVPPNVLLLLDNSGSMNRAAYQQAFDPATTYFGLFGPLECYDYGSNRFIPDPTPNPSTPGTCTNAPYLWSGNLLNYGAMRRIDIVKWVMMGGTCSVGGRDAMGGCRQLIAQKTFSRWACCKNQTQGVLRSQAVDRMPGLYLPPPGGTVYFHLMGSRNSLKGTFCVDNDRTKPRGWNCGDGDAYAESNWVLRVDLFENASGVIQQVGDKARFGLMEFKGAGDGGKVLHDVGGNIQNMITGIEATTPSTWTPLAESLYEATRYFAQVPPAYTNSDYSYNVTSRDPYYFKAPKWANTTQYVPCCRSFVIIFTDGESTQDLNIPAALQDYADSVHGLHCRGAGCSGHRTDYPSNGSHYLDDVAYWAHTSDLRQATLPVLNEPGKDLPGLQNLTIYTFFAFGSGSELLQSTAKTGGFDDKNGNSLPDLSEEWDRVNNLTGAAGPDGIPDTYFESNDAFQLKSRLLAAVTSVLQRSSSGSSVSVLASSSTGEGALYQSFFFPSTFEGFREITWTGYTQGLFVDGFGNLREDTHGDSKLIYEDDRIIRSRLDPVTNQVVVDRFSDADGNGLADSSTPISTVDLKEVQSMWEAGEHLAQMASSSRKILTWVDSDADGVVDSDEQLEFTTSSSSTLAPYLRAEPTAPYTAGNIIRFIRGEQVAGLRERQLTVGGALNVWKLGDPVHSQPLAVGAPAQRYGVIYGDASYSTFFQQYKNRRQVVYVGANDGMLHAFNAGHYHRGDDPSTSLTTEHGWFTRTPTDNSSGPLLGEELFGFIPQELLPHLKWLTMPEYSHVYYVDLTPKVTDARIFPPDADHPSGWGTILMGGFRLGGSCGACSAATGAPPMQVTADFDGNPGTPDETRTFYSAYFVLDITNPESPDYPKLLWSFSSADLGLTTTVPSMLRVSPAGSTRTDNAGAKWYMVAGSGPTGYEAGSTQRGRLYAIDLAQGPGARNTNVIPLTAETLNAFLGNTLTIDRNFDYRVDVTYMGSVIDTSPWRGKLYRLMMNGCAAPCLPTTWGIDGSGGNRLPTELLDMFPVSNTLQLGPIAATPAVAIDDSNKLWVFAGTGRYYTAADKSNTEQQYVVGIKDPVMNAACTESTRTNCHANALVDVSAAKVCVVGVGDCGAGTDQVTGVTGVTDVPSLINLVASTDGWYTTLPTSGERALSRPTVFGGIVFFPTFTPVNDLCSASGNSTLYALHYMTGGPYSEPVIGTESKSGKEYVKRSTALGKGMATQAVVHIGKAGREGDAQLFSQSSSGELISVSANAPGGITSRFLSWYHVKL